MRVTRGAKFIFNPAIICAIVINLISTCTGNDSFSSSLHSWESWWAYDGISGKILFNESIISLAALIIYFCREKNKKLDLISCITVRIIYSLAFAHSVGIQEE